MPKIISYTPTWLSRPAPGYHLFSKSQPSQQGSESNYRGQNGFRNVQPSVGHRRTIARRGTEIFVVVDNEIRWSDLCMLKDVWEEAQERTKNRRESDENGEPDGNLGSVGEDIAQVSYRVLKIPRSEPIQQLSISPNNNFLAILTSHTVRVAILPKSSYLGQAKEPLKLKAYTLGPTTHVLSQSPLIRALWHPCGVSGNCLVTITADAVVRVWELNCDNRWTFDTPSLGIDLKKLALGESQEEDFAPYRIGRNRGFSSDSVGMEVVSACFGGTGSGEESAWSAMTLWIAMRDGDIYALCPLIPSKWQPSPTLVPSLATIAVSKDAMYDGKEASDDPAILQSHREQYQWISDIDSQVPNMVPGATGFSPWIETFSRPLYPGPIPKLQGPFQFFPDDSEDEVEFADIHVIAAKLDMEELLGGDGSNSESEMTSDAEGLSVSVICVMTRSGKLHLCLDSDGVEGQWLPSKKSIHELPSTDGSQLVLFETLDTVRPDDAFLDGEWPNFSLDPRSRYSFFVTHSRGVFFFSLDPWLETVEKEFQNASTDGAEFRFNILRNGPGTLRERILKLESPEPGEISRPITACVVLEDSDLGYFLLTCADEQPHAVIFDQPKLDLLDPLSFKDEEEYRFDQEVLTYGAVRSAYQPPASFWAPSSLTTFFSKQVSQRHKKLLKEEIRLSTNTLDLMTEAHRILSQETHRLGLAAADLFRRCERLQDELRDQIKRTAEATERIEEVIGENGDDDDVPEESPLSKIRLEKRLEQALAKQGELTDRHERLRRDVARSLTGRLSEKEELWVSEIEKMGKLVIGDEGEGDEEDEKEDERGEEEKEEQRKKPWQRFQEAIDLAQELVSQAKQLAHGNRSNGNENHPNGSHPPIRIPSEVRKAKVDEVTRLLDRESTLVEAATSRLMRLTLSSIS